MNNCSSNVRHTSLQLYAYVFKQVHFFCSGLQCLQGQPPVLSEEKNNNVK